jgi:glycolate oxidase iron-sulfur subunit
MRSVVDGRLALSDPVRTHLDRCLDCRACESACPSGVQYGRLIEPFKVAMQTRSEGKSGRPSWLLRLILHHVFPYAGRVRVALAPARLLQRLGLFERAEAAGLLNLLPGTLRRLAAMLPDGLQTGERLPEVLPPIGPRRARVAFFTGCVADAMYPATHAATARVLQRNGCEVVVPRGQVCCGAIHYHSGAEAPALQMARRNLAAFDPEAFDAIIVNAAGCGAMLKDYDHLLPASERPAAERFVAKVKDVHEFLIELGPVPPAGRLPLRLTYHDACHLCHGQQIRTAPRQLLGMIPGVELVPLEETEICCGAAGTYNLTQPDMSRRLGERKVDRIVETGAACVATGNVGCIIQIDKIARQRGCGIEVVHPMDLLDRAYRAGDAVAGPARPLAQAEELVGSAG